MVMEEVKMQDGAFTGARESSAPSQPPLVSNSAKADSQSLLIVHIYFITKSDLSCMC
jgi:hypothetical protein